MAPLPFKFDPVFFVVRDLLNRGERAEAIDRIKEAKRAGTAGAETLKLADYLATAKRGRQPFGSKHLWYDIGRDNDCLRSEGMKYEDRIQKLSEKYRLGDKSKLKTAIAEYERGMEETRRINDENRDG